MNYYHLATHPLAKKLSNFIDKNWAAREKLVEFTKSVGAENCCGWNFFFKDDKKPNKHWIKSKKQKWQNFAKWPSKKEIPEWWPEISDKYVDKSFKDGEYTKR